MKNTFYCLFLLLFTFLVFPAAAQNNPTGTNTTAQPENDLIFMAVEDMPDFPGGKQAMGEFLGSNIKYPPVAMRNGLEGLVVLSFVVNQTGNIEDIQVLKPLGGGCDEEAVRVIKMMPAWKPGKQNGKKVKTRFTLPVRFALADPEPETPAK